MRVCEGLITCLTKQENIFSFLCSVAAIALALQLNFLVGWIVKPAISGIHYWCAGRMGSGFLRRECGEQSCAGTQRWGMQPHAGILFFGGWKNIKLT